VRILQLTQWFQPEPFFKGLPFAKALQARGHHVEVLTGIPNYPGGKVYPGYSIQPYRREVLDGVTVHRAPLLPSHSSSGIGRIINYASFAASASLVGLVADMKPDVIYAYHPPATVAFPAWLLARRFGAKVVYDIQDLWPDTLRATGMVANARVLSMVGAWCRWVYRAVDHIVVLSPGFKRMLVGRGVPAERVTVIPNWADEFTGMTVPRPRETFDVLFAGNLGRAQDLGTVVRAAAIVRDLRPNVRFVLMGNGLEREHLQTLADELGAGNVEFTGHLSPIDAAGRMRAAGALLVHLRRDPLFEVTIPSKTQAYLDAGRPILMGVAGDAADLVRRAGAGVCFAPGQPEALAEAVIALADLSPDDREAMGTRGSSFYRRELSQSVAIARFEALFEQLVVRR
jgi:colanic acid biosynthesis glycosyl transferase WcaI